MEEDKKKENLPASPKGPDSGWPPSPPGRHGHKGTRVLVWFVILAAFGALFWVVLRHHETQAAQTSGRRGAVGGAVTITAVTAQKGSIGQYQPAIGIVTPVYTDSITSQVTGQIAAVHYREGQQVSRGEPLLEIDSRPYEAQLLEAQGALQRDSSLLAQAQMDLARYQAALARDAIAKQTEEDQEKLVQQYEGSVKGDQGTVQFDQVQVSYCHITAPIAGRVGLRLVDPGNVVQANSSTPLVVITQEQPITVVFTIPEDSVGEVTAQMRHGRKLQVTAYDRTGQTKLATGELQTIDNQIDTTTGTVKLRALFGNKDGALFPNLFVNTQLLVKTLQGVTLIPSSAIQQNGSISFVYVIQNGVAQIRDIKPGVANSGMAAVEGINPGDVVANSSFEKLQSNSKVVIVKTPPPASTAGSNTL